MSFFSFVARPFEGTSKAVFVSSTSGMLKRAARALRLANSGSSSSGASTDAGADSAGVMDVVVCALMNIQTLLEIG